MVRAMGRGGRQPPAHQPPGFCYPGEHQGDLAFLNDLAREKLMPGVNSSSCCSPPRGHRLGSQLLLFHGLNIEQKSSILS